MLQKSLAPLAQHHASYRETMVIDTEKGPDKYMRYAESIQSSLDIELLSHADPTAFRTTDPDTTICFLGPAAGVCELAGRFANKVFSDGFEGCTATESEITMTFRAASMVVPRCQ